MGDIEKALLIYCARAHITPDIESRVKAILRASTIDWELFNALAYRHSVTNLVYFNLSRLANDVIPPDLLRETQQISRTTLLRTLFWTSQLQHLLNSLNQNGIDVLVYKGPALAQLAYGRLDLRQFTDLDLIVETSKLKAAKDIILSFGYELVVKPDADADGRSYQGYDLFHPTTQVAIDLQDRFGVRYSSFAIAFADLWKRNQIVMLGNVQLPTLSNNDYLLVLCAHGAQHRWGQLKWICDIAELLCLSPSLDWTWILAQAKVLRIERILFVGLTLAVRYFDATVPEIIQTAFSEDDVVLKLAEDVYYWLFHEVETLPDLFRRQRFEMDFDIKLRDQFRNRISNTLYILRRRIEPKIIDTNAVKLPKYLRFIYYIYRPIRILVKYGFNRRGT